MPKELYFFFVFSLNHQWLIVVVNYNLFSNVANFRNIYLYFFLTFLSLFWGDATGYRLTASKGEPPLDSNIDYVCSLPPSPWYQRKWDAPCTQHAQWAVSSVRPDTKIPDSYQISLKALKRGFHRTDDCPKKQQKCSKKISLFILFFQKCSQLFYLF